MIYLKGSAAAGFKPMDGCSHQCSISSIKHYSLERAAAADPLTEAAWRGFYSHSKKKMLASENPYCHHLALKFQAEDDAKAASAAIDLVMKSLK